jgi:hypothetical protein
MSSNMINFYKTGTIGSGSSGQTNLIPQATDASGAIYNGKGYKENCRWSSSSQGESANNNYDITGFIPCVTGNTLHIVGITVSSASSPYIVLFNASK